MQDISCKSSLTAERACQGVYYLSLLLRYWRTGPSGLYRQFCGKLCIVDNSMEFRYDRAAAHSAALPLLLVFGLARRFARLHKHMTMKEHLHHNWFMPAGQVHRKCFRCPAL